jgi:CheY-like chemotaxis protein
MKKTIPNNMASWVVLIVDDEPDNLGVAMKILDFNGAQVHVAEDGVEGMNILKSIAPTFILLDLSMPNMDGWEMLKHIRQNEATAAVPVIALTAHAMAGDEERALAAGFNGYITKPFRLDSFLSDIKRHLGLSQTDQAIT